MKKVILILLVFSMIFLASCDILSLSSSATMKESFDFVNEEADVDLSDADIIIEPWTGDPALQLMDWGNADNKLLDMGKVTISEAKDMSLSDGTTGYDDWTQWPFYVNHVYTFLNKDGDRVYMLITDIDMSTYDTDYNTEVSFDYEIVEE